MKKFIGTTIGMVAYHRNFKNRKSKLIRFYFYDIGNKEILIIPFSGHSLKPIRNVCQTTISKNVYNNRPDYNIDEFKWASNLLDFEV